MVVYRPSGKVIEKPPFADKLVELSEKLAGGFPTMRVDWYYQEGRIYFGEMTFFTWGGFAKFIPEKWNRILGDWIELPKEKTISKT